MDEKQFPPYVNIPPKTTMRSASNLAPTPEHQRSISYEDTTASTSTDSVPEVRLRTVGTQETSPQTTSSVSPIPAPRVYMAQFDYIAQNKDELDLKPGSIVKLVTADTHEDGWLQGELGGKIGLFPSNYVQLLPVTEKFVEFTADQIKLPDSSKKLDDYQIGRGATATVFKVDLLTFQKDGSMTGAWEQRKAALKRFEKSSFVCKDHVDQLKQEANLVSGLSHKNIVSLLGICLEDVYCGLLLELCEGSSLQTVYSSMDPNKAIPLTVLVDWAKQIAEGMEYLIGKEYVHRDLKANNVLVKEEVCLCFDEETMNFDWCSRCGRRPLGKLTLKITDFGVTRKMTTDANRFSAVGTLAWLAPEAFRKNDFSESSDVWSFGVVLWEILSRKEPFHGKIAIAIAFKNATQGQSLIIDNNCPKRWKDIMQKCWAIEAKDRPKFTQLVQDFKDYSRELVDKHVQRAPSIMAVKEIYTACFIDQKTELEKMFNDLYSDIGTINRKNRHSIAPETKARKTKNHKGKKPEITGPMGEVKHIVSVQVDKGSDKTNFKIKYGDEASMGGTLPRLNDRTSNMSISTPDLFQTFNLNSGSRISRQPAIRKKKTSNAFDTPVVSPTYQEDGFAKIENADEIEATSSKEVKNGTFSKVFAKFPWRSHKNDTKEEEGAGSISSRSSSTASSNRIRTGPATRSAVAPAFLDISSRQRAHSAVDTADDPMLTRKNRVSPANKHPVKHTNMNERFTKGSDYDTVVRPSQLPSSHRRSALDQTIPASPSSSDSGTNFSPAPLSSRRTTASSSIDGSSYEFISNSHGKKGQIIKPPKLEDVVPIAADQPTHFFLRNGQIYDGEGMHIHGGHSGFGHGKPTYYPVGGGCDEYVPVAGTRTIKPTVGEINNDPYTEMSNMSYGRNVQNPQYVHCKAQKSLTTSAPLKIHSESNLMATVTAVRSEKLNGIGNSASSFSLNEPPDIPAPLPPRISMSPPTRLAPVLNLGDDFPPSDAHLMRNDDEIKIC